MTIREKYDAKLARLGMMGLRGGDAVHEPPIPPDPPVPLSEEEILAFESELGARLPDDYRQFLLLVGAAAFVQTCVRPIQVREDYGDLEVIEDLYGGKADIPNLWTMRAALLDVIPKHLIPIGHEASGGKFCIAVKGPERGQIFLSCSDDGKLYLTATSFDDFLDRLISDPP